MRLEIPNKYVQENKIIFGINVIVFIEILSNITYLNVSFRVIFQKLKLFVPNAPFLFPLRTSEKLKVLNHFELLKISFKKCWFWLPSFVYENYHNLTM